MDSSGVVVLNVLIELFANEMTHWPIGQLAHPSFGQRADSRMGYQSLVIMQRDTSLRASARLRVFRDRNTAA